MALTVDFEKFGTTFTDAYVKIQRLEYLNTVKTIHTMSEDPDGAPEIQDVKELRVSFMVCIFPSLESSESLHTSHYSTSIETGDDVIGACYEYLKTLDAFADAVDA